MSYAMTVYPTRSSALVRWRTPLLLAGAALASAYFYVRAKTHEAEQQNPPAGKFIDVDGVRLHYLERGAGPALVLLHGNGILANDFDTSGLIQRAANRYRVIAFDRPGYGYSERPRTTIWTPAAQARLLHKALRQLGVAQPIVLGHSWGTLVALSMALEYPDDVRALALLSGYYYPSLRLDTPVMAQPAVPLIGDVLRLTIAPLLARLLWPRLVSRVFQPAPVPEDFARLPVWMMLRPSQLRASAAESALMIPAAHTLSKQYPQLTMPITIIAGSDDQICDVDHNAERLHRELPHTGLRIEPGQGHMVHYARLDDILAAIDALAQQPPRPAAPAPSARP